MNCFFQTASPPSLADIPIDTISSTMLIISIGVCVDYSAHIAHYFLGAKGRLLGSLRHLHNFCLRRNRRVYRGEVTY